MLLKMIANIGKNDNYNTVVTVIHKEMNSNVRLILGNRKVEQLAGK